MRLGRLVLPLIALGSACLCFAGVFLHYSPVPFWDSWDGAVGFFLRADSGAYDAWLEQHNEHRLLLSRILFWAEYRFFGSGRFLLMCNLALLLLAFFLFTSIRRKLCGDLPVALTAAIGVLLFSWVQHENLTWEFQIQWFLGQLVPLASFYFLARSLSEMHSSRRWFASAATAGALAPWTMAAGLLVPPLLTIMCLLTRARKWQVGCMSSLTAATTWLYLSDYARPSGGGQISDLLRHPIRSVLYSLDYLGSPLGFALQSLPLTDLVARLLGAAVLLFILRRSIQWYRAVGGCPLELGMLLFGWFVVGQALLTAAGRSSLSVSIASRYTTPAIFLLCCVLCLVIPCNPTSIKPRAFLAAIVLVLVPYQLKAIERPSERNASRMLAALSMELGVYDEAYTSQIFPSVAWLEELAEPAIEANVAVFGGATLQDQRQRLGEYAGIARRDDCDLTGEVAWQEVGRGFQRVTLLVDGREDERRESMPVIDEAGLYVGQLLRFPEIGSGPTQVRQRYVGYISAAPSLRSMSYRAPGSGCDHAFTTGGRAFKVISPELAASLPHATSTAVVGSHTWSGTDYYRSEVPGYAVFGSYVNSDQDQGSLTLRLARDSVIQVRTGSDNSNQYLVIPDLDNSTYILPVSLDWTYLSFSAEGLPDSFEIILSDQGTGWGQWSAVLLKEPS